MRSIRRRPPSAPGVPGLAVLAGWRATGRADAVAGTAVAAYLIPQCMAYAGLAGLPAVRGLWAALPALAVYALLGTSSRLSVGPESASALLVGSALATLGAGAGTTERAELAAALALAVAAVAVVARALRLGFIADLLSRPVLLGYMAGVAVAMAVSQLPNVTGIDAEESSTWRRAGEVVADLGDLRPAPAILAATVVVVLFAVRRWPRVPGPLLVVLAATAVTALGDLDERGVATIGNVPGGLPPLALPSLPGDQWAQVVAAGLGISLVVFTDNILSARAFAARAGDRIDADQELVALAGANAGAGLLGGFPVSSSGSRTAVADAAGGRSQLASVVAAGLIAVVLLAGGSVLESFPLAALGGLVIYAAAQLVDLPEIRRAYGFRRTEGFLVLAAFLGVVVFGVLAGVAVAVALSVVELFARIARAHDAVLGSVPGLAGLHDIDDHPMAQTLAGLVVYRYDAPLCFANAEDFRVRVIEAVEAEASPVAWVLLNMEANVEIDLTATDMLEDLRAELDARDIVLALARVKQDLRTYLDRTGLIERIGDEHVYPTLPTALDAFRASQAGGES